MTEGRRKIFIRDAHSPTSTHSDTHTHVEEQSSLMNIIKTASNATKLRQQLEQVEQNVPSKQKRYLQGEKPSEILT